MNDIEKTLVIIKNDAIKRSLVGKILQKFEEAGLKIIEMKMTIPTEAEAKAHYNMGNNLKWLTGVGMKAKSMYSSEKAIAKRFNSTNAATIGKAVYHWSVLQLQNKPVVVLVLQSPSAIGKVKKIVGSTVPSESDMSTIRGMFSS